MQCEAHRLGIRRLVKTDHAPAVGRQVRSYTLHAMGHEATRAGLLGRLDVLKRHGFVESPADENVGPRELVVRDARRIVHSTAQTCPRGEPALFNAMRTDSASAAEKWQKSSRPSADSRLACQSTRWMPRQSAALPSIARMSASLSAWSQWRSTRMSLMGSG